MKKTKKRQIGAIVGFLLAIMPPILFDSSSPLWVRILSIAACAVGCTFFVIGISEELHDK